MVIRFFQSGRILKSKRFLVLLFAGIFSYQFADAQQINISPTSESIENTENEYTIYNRWGDAVQLQKFPNTIEFLSAGYTKTGYEQMSIAPGGLMFAFLERDGNTYNAEVVQDDGEKVHRIEEIDEHDENDPSPKLYVLDNGELFYRYNISFFRHYDSNGKQLETIDNTSGSQEGEVVSELKRLPHSNAVLFYNPRVLYQDDQVGSRIQYYDGGEEAKEIFSSENRYIEDISLSANGQLMVLHLKDDASGNHYAEAIDLDGNSLFSIAYDDFEPLELTVSKDGRYLTSRGSGRVMTHDMHTGESKGSTSLRQSTLAANYSAERNQILILTGSHNESNYSLSNLEFRVVDVMERSIDSIEIEGNYFWNQLLPITIDAKSSNEFRISGINRNLDVVL